MSLRETRYGKVAVRKRRSMNVQREGTRNSQEIWIKGGTGCRKGARVSQARGKDAKKDDQIGDGSRREIISWWAHRGVDEEFGRKRRWQGRCPEGRARGGAELHAATGNSRLSDRTVFGPCRVAGKRGWSRASECGRRSACSNGSRIDWDSALRASW